MPGQSAPRSGGRRRPAPRGPKPRIVSWLPPPPLPRARLSPGLRPRQRGERLVAPPSPRGPRRRGDRGSSARDEVCLRPSLPAVRWGSMRREPRSGVPLRLGAVAAGGPASRSLASREGEGSRCLGRPRGAFLSRQGSGGRG